MKISSAEAALARSVRKNRTHGTKATDGAMNRRSAPQRLGLRQSFGAFEGRTVLQSARGLAQSKTLRRGGRLMSRRNQREANPTDGGSSETVAQTPAPANAARASRPLRRIDSLGFRGSRAARR